MIKKSGFKAMLCLALVLALPHCDTIDNTWQEDLEAFQQQVAELYQNYDWLFKEFLANTVLEMGKEVLKYEEIHPDLLAKKITFTGNHYDVGKFVGLMGRKQGINLTLRTPESEAINKKIKQMYTEVFPPFLDRLRGIANAYELDLKDVDLRFLEHAFSGNLWWDLFQYSEFLELTKFSSQKSNHCSVISYYLKSEKRHLLGRNWDPDTDR